MLRAPFRQVNTNLSSLGAGFFALIRLAACRLLRNTRSPGIGHNDITSRCIRRGAFTTNCERNVAPASKTVGLVDNTRTMP